MRFASLIPLLISSTKAFTIPEGQPDGVYQVTKDANGTEIHTLLGELEEFESGSAHHGRRAVSASEAAGTVICGGYQLPHGDADAAWTSLGNMCGNGAHVLARGDVYALSNCVVAYFCNQGDHAVYCFSSDKDQGVRDITNSCGSYWSGWEFTHPPTGQVQVGYEDVCGAGKNFCGHEN
ncbi:hypothetical protein F4802DRAFT_600582 [Xylaria palmicola]|nr:hypothetical protein F4802DRAFT_600582 [Xylaria palmicola]